MDDQIDAEADLEKEKESNKELQSTIQNLKEQIAKQDTNMIQLKEQCEDANKQTKLAEKQYDGLKVTIQRLQNENDTLQKNYSEIEGRILQEKEKFVDLMNKMNKENEELQKKIDMLTELNKQEKKRFIWSAKGGNGESTGEDDVNLAGGSGNKSTRMFGGAGVVVPTSIKQKIMAHQRQTTSLR